MTQEKLRSLSSPANAELICATCGARPAGGRLWVAGPAVRPSAGGGCRLCGTPGDPGRAPAPGSFVSSPPKALCPSCRLARKAQDRPPGRQEPTRHASGMHCPLKQGHTTHRLLAVAADYHDVSRRVATRQNAVPRAHSTPVRHGTGAVLWLVSPSVSAIQVHSSKPTRVPISPVEAEQGGQGRSTW